MRIAFIVDGFPNLSETFILNQITGLIDLGHEVEIFAQVNPKSGAHIDVEMYDLMDHAHYPVAMPTNRLLRILKFLAIFPYYFLKDPRLAVGSINPFQVGRKALGLHPFYRMTPFFGYRFDALMCHFGQNGNFATWLRRAGYPGKIVTMFHGYGIRRGIEKGGHIYNELFKYGDVILAISDYNYEHLIKFGAPDSMLVRHPNGIAASKFTPKDYSKSTDQKSVTIMSVGRLVWEKGYEYALPAIEEVIKRNPDTKITYRIIGAGILEAELKQQAKDLGIEQNIDFAGGLEYGQVIKSFPKADIYLLSSVAEALPTVLMEAQASALPIVATDVGSVKDLVTSAAGYVVPPNDFEAMAEKLDYLIKHRTEWEQMGMAGRDFILENYDVDKLNKSLVEIFQTK